MSKKDNRKYIDTYQRMLRDGSAFKEVDITMHNQPSIAEAEGVIGQELPETPVLQEAFGDKVETPDVQYHNDYSEFDDAMQKRMESLKAKAGGRRNINEGMPQDKRIKILEKRVKRLEDALSLVMETHEKLLG